MTGDDGAVSPWHATCSTADVLATTEEHALSQRALDLAHPFGIPITNSMVVTWIAAIALISFAQLATRNMGEVPSGAQNLLEWTIEGLYGFLKGILGPDLVERTFWFFATIFIFILTANWIGLVPGVGSIGWGHQADGRFVIDEPLFRGANAGVNMTLAMALVFFVCWIVWSFQTIGTRGVVKELFGTKGESAGPARDDGACAAHRMARAGTVLSSGAASRIGAGARLHVVDGGGHPADVPARET